MLLRCSNLSCCLSPPRARISCPLPCFHRRFPRSVHLTHQIGQQCLGIWRVIKGGCKDLEEHRDRIARRTPLLALCSKLGRIPTHEPISRVWMLLILKCSHQLKTRWNYFCFDLEHCRRHLHCTGCSGLTSLHRIQLQPLENGNFSLLCSYSSSIYKKIKRFRKRISMIITSQEQRKRSTLRYGQREIPF